MTTNSFTSLAGRKRKGRVPRAIRRRFPNVKFIRWAKYPVEINTTQRDCAKGVPLSGFDCALAIAAGRQFHIDGAYIGLAVSYLIKGNTAIRFATPNTVAREITSFNRHHDFAPGLYRLSPICPSQQKPVKSRPGAHSPGQKARYITHKHTVRVRQMV